MLSTTPTTRPRGGTGDARPRYSPPSGRAEGVVLQEPRIEPDPLPCLPGTPPAKMRRPDGRPPCGYTFMGAKATVDGYLLPCPLCWRGWVPLAPNRHEPDGYRLAVEVGCSRGCDDAAEMMRAHLLCLSKLSPPPPPSARERAYATACARRILRDLPARPSLPRLRSAAHELGSWLEAGDLDEQAALAALLNAAARNGLDRTDAGPVLGAALASGRLQPGRLPQ